MGPIDQQQIIRKELDEQIRRLSTELPTEALPRDVQQMLECMHERLFQPSLDVDKVLEICEIRSPGIYRRFASHVGVTPRRYLEDRRIMAAMRLLTFPKLKIGLISFSVGYCDYETFARAFRRYVRCSPSAYRRRMLPVTRARLHKSSKEIIITDRHEGSS